MTESEIIDKIKYGLTLGSELSDLEFKTAYNTIPSDIWKTISALANSRGGGLVVFGINEAKNQVTGCENLQLMQTKLTEYFNDKMSHVLRPEYHMINLNGVTILAVYVPECPKASMPCYFKSVGLPNGAYIREANTSRRITDNEFRTYIATSREFQFDQSEAINVTRNDLSDKKILNFIKQGETMVRRGSEINLSKALLKNLGITLNVLGEEKITIGGFLLFAKYIPQKLNPYARYLVRCIRYAGNSVASDIIDSSDISGTLDLQIDEAYKFVLKNIKKMSAIVATKRVEQFEYPEAAIRELIANAIIHRDYKITETYTQIRIFSDRIEITSPGSLPPGVTVDNIKDAQFSRNLMIASILKDLDYLEEYGRGIDIVIKKMEEWGLAMPLFRNLINSFEVILLGHQYSKVNVRQMKIISALFIKGKLTVHDCQKILKSTPRATINKDLRDLKQLGIITVHGASVSIFYTLGF